VDFLCPTPAFAVIAVWAGSHNIRPDMLSPKVTRGDMVNGQVSFALPAVLAGIIVATKDLTTCQFDVWARAVDLVFQPDHGRTRQQLLYRTDMSTSIDDHVGFARQDQTNRAPCRTDVDWFEISIKD